jgi:hypothetical protein
MIKMSKKVSYNRTLLFIEPQWLTSRYAATFGHSTAANPHAPRHLASNSTIVVPNG